MENGWSSAINLNLTANESIIGRIGNLLERNRTLDALSGKDAYLFSQIVPGQRLSLDEGKLLASATIMAAPSVMAYEATMVEIQCALNVLAVQAQAFQ